MLDSENIFSTILITVLSLWFIGRGIRNYLNPVGKRIINPYVYLWLRNKNKHNDVKFAESIRSKNALRIDAILSLIAGIVIFGIYIAAFTLIG